MKPRTIDARGDSNMVVQNRCQHHGAVLGEGLGQGSGVLEPHEMTSRGECQALFLGRKPKHEIARETMGVAPHLLVEGLGSDAVELRQIGVEHDSLSPDREDALLD